MPSLMRKKSKEDEQTMAELSSAHRRSQAKCQLVQTSYIKRIIFFFISLGTSTICIFSGTNILEENSQYFCI